VESQAGEQFLTVGDLARRFQVSPTAVQRWDGLGWLVPVMRLSNGARLYRPEDVERFADLREKRLTAEGAV
jgi:DNA-binding transcriptional MerR regulator